MSNAILEFSRALARANSSDLIEVPAVVNGEPAMVKLLLGPASQLIDLPSPEGAPALDDKESLAEIGRRMQRLQPTRAIPEETPLFVDPPVDDL